MKKFLHLPFLLLSFAGFSQDLKDPLDMPPPHVIVQTGIGLQWFGETYKLYTLSAEKPFGHFWHLGLQGTFYLKNDPDYFYYSSRFLDGFEMGGFAKYFLHGRFSGRKSGLYLGPELRFGARKFQISFDNFFPPPPQPNYQTYKERVTKIMLRWGIQWQFGHATLEVAAPFGAEFYKPSELIGVGYSKDVQFVMLPTLQLGVAF
ncbi:MAG: hypothetical protein H7246_09175 [Phycisphaerae bacterium]|nr:hypothetical protein [Saprospiraceae bacterium]